MRFLHTFLAIICKFFSYQKTGGTTGNLIDGVIVRRVCDYGDAPSGYPSASNSINNRLFLGTTSAPSEDLSDKTSPGANLDDNDDGIPSFPGNATQTGGYSITVNVTNTTGTSATLCGYVDFGQDGGFEADETVCTTVNNLDTSAVLNFTVPIDDRNKTGNFVHRFQITSNFAGVPDGEVEDYLVPITTLPVFISSFQAFTTKDQVNVQWSTATESRNAGFKIYAQKQESDSWVLLNEELLKSKVVDSSSTQKYKALFTNDNYQNFMLEDWDSFGNSKKNGPYKLGKQYGDNIAVQDIALDWKSIHAKNKLSQAQKIINKSSNLQNQILLKVDSDGIYSVSYEDLIMAGMALDQVRISTLALTDNNLAIPRFVHDVNVNELFDEGDSIEFFGLAQTDLYNKSNVYRLTIDSENAMKVDSGTINSQTSQVSQVPSYQEFSEENSYNFASSISDPWYEELIFATTEPSIFTKQFNLPGFTDRSAEMRLNIWGITNFIGENPDHHIILRINGHQLANIYYDGTSDGTIELTVPPGILVENDNEIQIEAPGDTGFAYDIQAIDGFEIDYYRNSTINENGQWFGSVGHSDILLQNHPGEYVGWKTDTQRSKLIDLDEIYQNNFDFPVYDRLTSSGNMVLSGKGDWHVTRTDLLKKPIIENITSDNLPGHLTDYLIISHPLFMNTSAMDQLKAMQEARGYQTTIVNVEDIYAAYSDYEVSPDAISSYILNLNPRFVLLVGADSYDYHDYLAQDSQSFIPTHYVTTHKDVTFTPADGKYADFNNDGVPELALGRLPVRTLEEFENLVSKYEVYQPPQDALFVSGPSEYPESYTEQSLLFSHLLPSDIGLKFVSVDELGLEQAQIQLNSELQIPSSRLINYIGHTGQTIWGNSSHEILLNARSLPQMSNANPHVLLQWGCWNNYFVNPTKASMGEAFITQSYGSAAGLGATSLTDYSLLNLLSENFFYQYEQNNTLGEVLKSAYAQTALQEPEKSHLLYGFALFGDPALPLR